MKEGGKGRGGSPKKILQCVSAGARVCLLSAGCSCLTRAAGKLVRQVAPGRVEVGVTRCILSCLSNSRGISSCNAGPLLLIELACGSSRLAEATVGNPQFLSNTPKRSPNETKGVQAKYCFCLHAGTTN